MRPRFAALSIAALLAAAGCGGGTAHPSGWHPAPGASPDIWSHGTGALRQTYRYQSFAFNGTLQDLASQQVTTVVLHYPGTHFDGSRIYRPCPGLAAVATFRDGARRILVQGFAVQGDRAVVVTYVRPLNTPIAAQVADAFRQALCVAPG